MRDKGRREGQAEGWVAAVWECSVLQARAQWEVGVASQIPLVPQNRLAGEKGW